MLKFAFKVRTKTTPKCCNQYLQPLVQIHNYSIRFAANNLTDVESNNIYSQRSIRYTVSKFWIEMPENSKSSFRVSKCGAPTARVPSAAADIMGEVPETVSTA